MGVEYRGQLCVGYTWDEFESIAEVNPHTIKDACLDEEWSSLSSSEKAEVFGLSKFAPYYDADYDDCIYGQSIAKSDDYSASRITLDRFKSIDQKVQDMIDDYGLVPSAYIMAEGT